MKKIIFIFLIFFLNKAIAYPKDLQWPIGDKGVQDTSLYFGVEDAVHSITRRCNGHFPLHLGVDIKTAPNTKVYPVYRGYVSRIGYAPGWGNYLVISHESNSWTSVYWHITDLKVELGDWTDTNKQIASVFDTTPHGDVSHLHLGLRKGPYVYEFSRLGIGGCQGEEYSLKGFDNPLDYLPGNWFYVVDDTLFNIQGEYRQANESDFYYGDGYKYLSEDTIAKMNWLPKKKGSYSFFAKSPITDKPTLYELIINNRVIEKKEVIMPNKGEHVLLFTQDLSDDQEITIQVTGGLLDSVLIKQN